MIQTRNTITHAGASHRGNAGGVLNQQGQSNAEYALILGLVAGVIILALVAFGGGIGGGIANVDNALSQLSTPTGEATLVSDASDIPATVTVTGNAPTDEATAVTVEPTLTSPIPTNIDFPTDAPTQGATEVPASDDGDWPGAPLITPTEPAATHTQPGEPGSTAIVPANTQTPVPPIASMTPVPPTVVPVYDSYFDAFDGRGNIAWNTRSGSWAVTNQTYGSSSAYAVVTADMPFDNYEFYADVQTVQSNGSNIWDVTMILFRVESASSFYAVMIKKDGVIELARNTPNGWQGWVSATSTKLGPFSSHRIRVKAIGNHIQVFIDNKKYVDFRDKTPILTGGIGFSNNNSTSRIDNVIVSRVGSGD